MGEVAEALRAGGAGTAAPNHPNILALCEVGVEGDVH
jgi:hypothetical protein